MYSSCEKYWEEYYQVPARTDVKLLDAIKDSSKYSEFVHYLEITGYDTILSKSESFTLFIPTNNAFTEADLNQEELGRILGYHIAKTVFIPSNINRIRKLETHIEKFALLTENENGIFLDGLALSQNSPLFKDGIFYEMEEVAYPRPSLYEYMNLINPVFTQYIDSRDSISLDYAESKPINFDPEGNTIYDSVYVITNRFERDFFPVSEESRDDEATMLIITEEKYNEALNLMAENLKGSFVDHNDIPLDWQSEFLLPIIFKNAVFEGSLHYLSFLNDSLENIQGDMIAVDNNNIDPNSRTLCSNGITFLYEDFTIPEELYLEEIKYEGEDLVVEISGGFFSWDKERVETSDLTKNPTIFDHTTASGGKYVTVNLPRGYSSSYSIQLKLPKVFPRKYTLVWRGNDRPSGLIAFYSNGEYIGEFDNFYFRYPVNGNNPVNGFNKIEFSVDNITSFEDVTRKMEYQNSGLGTLNGISIDYISLTPAD